MSNVNEFVVADVKTTKNRIECEYIVKGDWKKYFTKERKMCIEYAEELGEIPESVAVIPLLCNIMPVAWLCDAVITVPSLDKDFYEHFEDIKHGYETMYPCLEFKGKMNTSVVENISNSCEEWESAALFSGGVDAYTTFFRHIQEKICLLTLWGADIALEDEQGWSIVWKHTCEVAKEYNVGCMSIKTNFRCLLSEMELSKLVSKSGDGWWHGFQHGIGITSHVAPLAYKYGFKSVYIASSFPREMQGRYTCASTPEIDNMVHYCGAKVVHDAIDMNRQDKVRYIIEKKKEFNKPIKLRVCWETAGGENCCKCEKCYRTILEIVSEKEDPNNFGFRWNTKDIKRCKRDFKWKIMVEPFNIELLYVPLKKVFEENKEQIKNYERYSWIQKMNFETFNDGITKKIYNKLRSSKMVIAVWNRFFR